MSVARLAGTDERQAGRWVDMGASPCTRNQLSLGPREPWVRLVRAYRGPASPVSLWDALTRALAATWDALRDRGADQRWRRGRAPCTCKENHCRGAATGEGELVPAARKPLDTSRA